MRSWMACLAVAALCLIGAEGAAACSCAGPTKGQSVEEYVRERAKTSDGVIVGKLLRVEEHDEGGAGFGAATFTYLIKHSYKHEKRLRPGERVRIESNLSSASCGLPQQEGRRFGLFLERFEGRLGSSLCSLVSPQDLRRTFAGDERAASRPARASARPWCPAPGPGRRATGSRVPA